MTSGGSDHHALRHSLSHIMAQVVVEMAPGSTLAFGGYLDESDEIYYTLDLRREITPSDFPAIERRMHEVIGQNLAFTRREVSPEEARKLFELHPYKIETIEDIVSGKGGYDDIAREDPSLRAWVVSNMEGQISLMKEVLVKLPSEEKVQFEAARDAMLDGYRRIVGLLSRPSLTPSLRGGVSDRPITLYEHGAFVDVCGGPHVSNTSEIDPQGFNLTRVTQVRWRYRPDSPILHRLHLRAFPTKEQLGIYQDQRAALIDQAEQKRNDVLGPRLGLFLRRDQEVVVPGRGAVPVSVWAPGSPFFLPKGATIYNLLIQYLRELYNSYGYQEVITPQIFSWRLFELSGHADHYLTNMYHFYSEGEHLGLKPMNCPGHALMYASVPRSYRDLPLRLADFGRLHRLEAAGVLQGITRTRSFSQDDSHIFCSEDQIGQEVLSFVRLLQEVYSKFFDQRDLRVFLSTRPDPEKRTGTEEMWDRAESALKEALETAGVTYVVDPSEGAFYGPKIDFKVANALGRPIQIGTIQLDYSLPEKMGLEYIAAGGDRKQPVILHRAVLGSLERFIGLLIEHLDGAFAVWLAPVQAVIIPIADRHLDYAKSVASRLGANGMRVEVNDGKARMGGKIREAQTQKIPYMLVVGDKELAGGTVAVRLRTGQNLGAVPIEDFAARVTNIVRERTKEL